MSVAPTMSIPRYDPTKWLALALVISIGIHAGYALSRQGLYRDVVINKPIEIQIVEVKPPEPPPLPPPEPEKKPEPPKPKPIARAPVVKPPPDAPPPPTQEPPREEPKAPPPVVIGISMESTSAMGAINAPIGNSAVGAMPKKAVDPGSVQAYRAPNYVPPGGADSDPTVDGDEIKVPYPDEAKKAGIEGTVRLRVVVDDAGQVVDVKILSGPGYGLDEAARKALKRFRFKPAMKAGIAVSTTITYNYTFQLD
jgi:protein TonB